MDTRGILIHPEELTDNIIALLKKSKLNVLGLHPVGGATSDKSLANLLELIKTNDFQGKLQRVREMGISIEYELHALSWLLPREMYHTHPEWFRMNEEGQRVNDYNMCPSNQEALDYIQVRAAELATVLKSDSGRYYFWLDDVNHTFCNCKKCRSLSKSDQALVIYNAILKGIRSVEPNAKQCFLAYQETMVPPVTVKPAEGIFLEYAPIWRNTYVPMFDKNDEKNVEYCAMIEPLLAYFGKEDSQTLEYWLDNSLFSNWEKPPKPITICEDTIRKDIQFYRQCGFQHITTFGCYLSDDYIDLYGIPPIEEYGTCFSKIRHDE